MKCRWKSCAKCGRLYLGEDGVDISDEACPACTGTVPDAPPEHDAEEEAVRKAVDAAEGELNSWPSWTLFHVTYAARFVYRARQEEIDRLRQALRDIKSEGAREARWSIILGVIDAALGEV